MRLVVAFHNDPSAARQKEVAPGSFCSYLHTHTYESLSELMTGLGEVSKVFAATILLS